MIDVVNCIQFFLLLQAQFGLRRVWVTDFCDMAITTTKQWTFGSVRGRDETGPCHSKHIKSVLPEISKNFLPKERVAFSPRTCRYRSSGTAARMDHEAGGRPNNENDEWDKQALALFVGEDISRGKRLC